MWSHLDRIWLDGYKVDCHTMILAFPTSRQPIGLDAGTSPTHRESGYPGSGTQGIR